MIPIDHLKPGWWWVQHVSGDIYAVELIEWGDPGHQSLYHVASRRGPGGGKSIGYRVDDELDFTYLGPVERCRAVSFDEVMDALRDAMYTGEPAHEADHHRKADRAFTKILARLAAD